MSAPIARVRLDTPLPHLDRDFDYAIPDKVAGTVTVGSRVRVPFAGRLVGAIVTGMGDRSEFGGRLLDVKSASAVPSFTPEALDLAASVARRYCGSVWDVCRLMAPPRVAAVEKREWSAPVPDEAYEAAQARLDVAPVASMGERVVWEALPEQGRCSVPVRAVVATAVGNLGADGSALIVVPDARAQALVIAECERLGLSRWTTRSGGQVAVLDHDDGPTVRFSSYLAAMHGHARIVVGTRAAVLQPVPKLSALVLWDEANSVYDEPHSPYLNARTVAAMRAIGGVTAVVGGYAVSVDAAALAEHGWARWSEPERAHVRAATPAVDVLTDDRRQAEGGAGWHWMPGSVWRTVRRALEQGPVGVIVPRAGYVNAAACARCGEWATCRDCDSPLAIAQRGSDPVCVENAHPQPHWHCPECHSRNLKHVRQGVESVAEQLVRMAPGVAHTVSSAATGIVADFAVTEGLVVSTPAALPAVKGGYAHLVIVDAAAPAGLGLGGELKAVRWWLSAAALVRPRTDGGAVTAVGNLPDSVRRALITWSPAGAAREAYEERAELGFPPHRRHVQLSGEREWVDAALARANVSDGVAKATVIPREDGASALVTRGVAQQVVDACREVQREASKAGGDLRLRVDGPLD